MLTDAFPPKIKYQSILWMYKSIQNQWFPEKNKLFGGDLRKKKAQFFIP